jgi:hypothetical protein
MEALAATATVVQISIYASNVTSALQELRQTIRHGSAKLRGQSQRLDVLEVVVKKIEQDPRLQSQQVAGYLATVRDDILRLHGLVLNNIQSPRDTFLRKVGAGIALLKADKRIETAFANLEKDCGVITLYMSRYESSPTMAENQQQQTMQFNQRGELVSTDSHEVSLLGSDQAAEHTLTMCSDENGSVPAFNATQWSRRVTRQLRSWSGAGSWNIRCIFLSLYCA